MTIEGIGTSSSAFSAEGVARGRFALPVRKVDAPRSGDSLVAGHPRPAATLDLRTLNNATAEIQTRIARARAGLDHATSIRDALANVQTRADQPALDSLRAAVRAATFAGTPLLDAQTADILALLESSASPENARAVLDDTEQNFRAELEAGERDLARLAVLRDNMLAAETDPHTHPRIAELLPVLVATPLDPSRVLRLVEP